MTILVPIDDDASSEVALRAAEQIARDQQSRIVVVTVGELPETSELEADARSQLQERLERASSWITEVPVDRRVQLAGDPVRGILEVARDEHADRIVMTSPQHDVLSALLDRSVSDEVREETQIPVTVIETQD